MYFLKPGVKEDPVRRWLLPDRIFFGFGACHILAGVYQRRFQDSNFRPFWIRPPEGMPGNHILMLDGQIAFDFHGYCEYSRLVGRHSRGWAKKHPGWHATVVPVDFDLLHTDSLNARNMRGPDQYLGDPVPRAAAFLDRFDHAKYG